MASGIVDARVPSFRLRSNPNAHNCLRAGRSLANAMIFPLKLLPTKVNLLMFGRSGNLAHKSNTNQREKKSTHCLNFNTMCRQSSGNGQPRSTIWVPTAFARYGNIVRLSFSLAYFSLFLLGKRFFGVHARSSGSTTQSNRTKKNYKFLYIYLIYFSVRIFLLFFSLCFVVSVDVHGAGRCFGRFLLLIFVFSTASVFRKWAVCSTWRRNRTNASSRICTVCPNERIWSAPPLCDGYWNALHSYYNFLFIELLFHVFVNYSLNCFQSVEMGSRKHKTLPLNTPINLEKLNNFKWNDDSKTPSVFYFTYRWLEIHSMFIFSAVAGLVLYLNKKKLGVLVGRLVGQCNFHPTILDSNCTAQEANGANYKLFSLTRQQANYDSTLWPFILILIRLPTIFYPSSSQLFCAGCWPCLAVCVSHGVSVGKCSPCAMAGWPACTITYTTERATMPKCQWVWACLERTPGRWCACCDVCMDEDGAMMVVVFKVVTICLSSAWFTFQTWSCVFKFLAVHRLRQRLASYLHRMATFWR